MFSKEQWLWKIGNKYLTKFSGPETLVLQRLVQQECVNGEISECRLVRVYEGMFPMGKVGKYVRIIFKMLEHENSGYVKCGQFIQFISVVARGDAREKASLCFNLLDLRREGALKKQDFKQVRTPLFV
jgi:Ca2+-binding EF-hand superfamily protein